MEISNKIPRTESADSVVDRGMPLVRLAERERETDRER
jgi:hypothetical protein